ncbi:anthranilate synthase component I family protein [Vibrio nigripulchritudo]|nr:anthranilate synthase component I family protein [Vibrio nigripulchritudo]
MDREKLQLNWTVKASKLPFSASKNEIRERLLSAFSSPALFESAEGFEEVDGNTTKFMLDCLLDIQLINGVWQIVSSGLDDIVADELKALIKRLERSPINVLRVLRTYLNIPEGYPTMVVLAYSAARFIENLADVKIAENEPEIVFRVYRHVLTFTEGEPVTCVQTLLSSTENEPDIEHIHSLLNEAKEKSNHDLKIRKAFVPPVDATCQVEFLDAVERAKQYIVDGEIYQVQLSRKAVSNSDIAPIELYQCLYRVNPSPYMSFVDLGKVFLISSSPELMLRAEKGICQVRPIAGTIRKGREASESLLSDPKEQSEHIMLVDLARNDLAKCAKRGGVEVKSFMKVEDFGPLLHLVSTIETPVKSSSDIWDLITSNFPAGTMTGAPKVRSMEVIAELESESRGLFSGCVGYIDGAQSGVFSLTIRTIVGAPGLYVFRSAAGVVFDSDALAEWDETGDKIRSFSRAMGDENESTVSRCI